MLVKCAGAVPMNCISEASPRYRSVLQGSLVTARSQVRSRASTFIMVYLTKLANNLEIDARINTNVENVH